MSDGKRVHTPDAGGKNRLHVNMDRATADALRQVATTRGITYTEAIRRAVAVWAFLEDEVAQRRKIQITDGKTLRELELL